MAEAICRPLSRKTCQGTTGDGRLGCDCSLCREARAERATLKARRRYLPRVTDQPRFFGPKDAPREYAFDSLAAALGLQTDAALARRLRVSTRTIWRLRTVGLTESQADEYAGRAGFHPGLVWPGWWNNAMGGCDAVTSPRWDPWAALADRPHIVFRFAELPAATGGAIYWPRGDLAAIIIDPALGERERTAALAHELVHDERGGGVTGDSATARDEAAVEREVARRLVPLDEAARLLSAGSGHEDLTDYFGVPPYVTTAALRLLRWRSAWGRLIQTE